MLTTLRRDQQGFILATAILAMVVMGAAVAGGYFVANQEYRVGKSLRESRTAFYAAQAGLQREYANWPIASRWTMDGGQEINVGPVALSNGSAYRGTLVRLDNVPESNTDPERYYLIRITGLAPAPLLGEEVRNTQALVLRVRYYDFCCSAAITAKDHFEQAGNSLIEGTNTVPTAWAGQCDSASTANVPGIEVECDSCFSEEGQTHTLAGNPPMLVDTTLHSRSLTEWDEVTWDFLTSKAQKIYADGEIVTNTAPATTNDPMTGLPTCDESIRSNWGEPTNATHVCYNYMPIIYAQGSLTIQSNAYGQGILLVEGDLTIKGGYQFYGIIIVKGHVLTEGTAGKIWGSLIVGGQNTGTMTESRLAGAATVRYSACAVARAKRFANLARREALPLRAWMEALN